MAKFSKGLWVVVMDEDKALVMENIGTATHPVLSLKQRIDSADLLAANDRSARTQDHKQHEKQTPPDYHRMAGAVLAKAVADELELAGTGGAFSEVVLVAPPQVLGALRDQMPKAVAARVTAELHKELIHLPLPKIAEHLTADLATE